MRCLIQVVPAGDGWTISGSAVGRNDVKIPDRVLRPAAPPHARFPLPPAHPLAECDPRTHQLCEDAAGSRIADAFEAVHRLDPDPVDAKTFGRYLTRVLLGETWTYLERNLPAQEEMELELLIDPAGELAGLPWEMMCDGAGRPLAASPDRKFAITRLVHAKQARGPIEPLQLPLRVLFVVGKQIDDVIRPGAELIGLLRRLRLPTSPKFDSFQSTDLIVQYLGEATWDEIQNAAAQFRPAVVHVVCHGELDPGGAGTRLLLTSRQVDGDPASPKVAEPYRCSADRLLDLLHVNGWLPPVVIVNACHTGEGAADPAARAERSSSNLAFAARLVENGIAVALGMSGEVADRACQIFTLRFYQALMQQFSVSLATAQGRRAALLGFPDIQETLEWARPRLFLAEGVSAVLPAQPAVRDVAATAAGFRKLKYPEVLCDRYDFFQVYEHLRRQVPAARSPVVAFAVKEALGGVGKTRLLEEIAARAVFDNFVPCLVRHDPENPDPPLNLLEFALQLALAMEEARKHFRLPPRPMSNAMRLAFKRANIQPDPGDPVAFADQKFQLKEYLVQNRVSPATTGIKMPDIEPILLADCKALLEEVNRKTGEPHRMMILLDDLHRYEGTAPAILDQAREYGLGAEDLPLPLLCTYMTSTPSGKLIEDELRKRPDIRSVALNAFENDVDRRLAYSQFVAHWKYAITRRQDKREDVEIFFDDMSEYTSGRPKAFEDDLVRALIRTHHKYKTLVDADFEDLLAKWN